jgi:hypothetical protein
VKFLLHSLDVRHKKVMVLMVRRETPTLTLWQITAKARQCRRRNMKSTQKLGCIVLFCASLTTIILCPAFSRATPYASGVTNNAGTITFYLNESGANIKVTYEDGTTNAGLNGLTTGTNLAAGPYSFGLGAHTSYSIAVSKTGSGVAGLIDSPIQDTNGYMYILGDLRGVDVNKNPTSPYFGHIYFERYSPGMIYDLNSDGSYVTNSDAGIDFSGTSSPYRMAVAPDDYLMVGDFSVANSAIWRVTPDLSTNELVLGPLGVSAGQAAGVHGSEESRPLVLGNLASGTNCILLEVDGDWPDSGTNYNSLLVYSNISLSTIPDLTNPPSLYGPTIGLPEYSGTYLNNVYAGLTEGPNGYIYASQYRSSAAGNPPFLQIYDTTFTNLIWNSQYNGGASDYFLTSANGGTPVGIVDSAVSPDGKFVVGLGVDNHFTICSLTNGIPDVSTLYTVAPTSYAENARGVCWDAADNIDFISSGTALVESWTLGFTAVATTTGNASGSTGFSITTPSTTVSVVASNSIGSTFISQANSLGNPTSGEFVITRTGNVSSPLTVPFTLSGTAPGASYTIGSPNGVTLASGQTSTNITVAAVTDGIARPVTTLTLTLAGSTEYSFAPPGTATFSIINTAPDEVVASVAVPTMYNSFSNDYAAFILTRWGDTNAASFTVNNYTFAGTAIAGVDYTMPGPITFNPGDISYTNYISPLSNGELPVDSTTNPYVGNRTAIIGIAGGTGFAGGGTNSATLTIIDSATPPATVLYSDPLTDPNDAANWGVRSANDNMQTNAIDDTITFGYNLQSGDPVDYGTIPLPPSGATNALRVTVNKDNPNGAAAGVNLYPTNVSFSGNYAVRFNMNIIEGYNLAVTTEGVLFGINHSGQDTNWWTGSGLTSGWGPGNSQIWQSDGIWYWISVDGGAGLGDYINFSGNGGTVPNTGWELLAQLYRSSYADAFKTNIFTSIPATGTGAGLVANGSVINGSSANNWSDVEIKQYDGIVTLSIDKTIIYAYTNTTTFTNGTIMLGYNDPFDSVGTLDASVYFSNLKVVRIGSPFISQVALDNINGNVVINFTATDGDLTAGSFIVSSSSSVTGPFEPVSNAVITSLGSGAFHAVVPQIGSTQFYRVGENN